MVSAFLFLIISLSSVGWLGSNKKGSKNCLKI